MIPTTSGTVEVIEGSGPFACMLGGLLLANLTADPGKQRLVARSSGTVAIEVTDVDEVVRLRFDDGDLQVDNGPVGPGDLRLVGTADTVMGLSTVPLRFGLPDLLSGGGRMVTGRWVSGGLEIHGLPRGALLLRTVLSLLSVLS